MNIFHLHKDPRICAEYHCDKHVVKMILETGQMLSTAYRRHFDECHHYGIDFAGDLGTPIKAMADGIVTLAENDLYFTGATLIFDHGHGISTLYMHLDEIFVEKGDIVKQGDIIGTVGSSGRSTGPHLDVRLNWFGTRLDPATVLDIN